MNTDVKLLNINPLKTQDKTMTNQAWVVSIIYKYDLFNTVLIDTVWWSPHLGFTSLDPSSDEKEGCVLD